MLKHLLDETEAIELFCRVIAKADKIRPLEKFWDNTFLNNRLKDYDNKDLCKKISEKVFKTWDDGTIKSPKDFYEFGRKIRKSEPVVISQSSLEAYMEYIGDNDFKKSFSPMPLQELGLNKKGVKFYNTEWYFYRYDEDDSKQGVTRAILKLFPFGRAELVSFFAKSNSDELFLGRWKFEKNERYMSLKMRTDTGETDLRALIYVGINVPTLALGQIRNYGDTIIYCGSLMLEPKNNTKITKAKFISKTSKQEWGKLPFYVQDFFAQKEKNILRVTTKVTSDTSYRDWKKNRLKAKDTVKTKRG